MSRPDEVRAYIEARSVAKIATGCLEWQRGASSQGRYPGLWIDGRFEYVHRAMFAITNNELPEGSLKHETDSIEIHHTCHSRACCAPQHLEALTRRRHADIHRGTRRASQLSKAA
jgi:hypothetical protein